MKNQLQPGWAEKHIPAKGSQRAYSPLSRLHAAADSRGPSLTPEGRLGAQEARERRNLARLERSFR